MNPKLQKAFKISDGLAKLTHQKAQKLVKELQGAGVLTSKESQKVLSGVQKIKKVMYDSLTGELKKILEGKAKSKKRG